ncbi:MAG TPA: hypothetical protein IAA45_04910 [Candidatus Blautia gallistercoris]|uniref:Uncharacterized protein n=1 Tax=Candidatus Blautia gallistercoris TaxID=2838490 RepID=A0A9D1WH26_9FIRM|nr:hypothetical protein [Candidatus Blautia gallistercoris]
MGAVKITYGKPGAGYQRGKVTVSRHQEAVIFSCEEEYPEELVQRKEKTAALIGELQKVIEAQGGLVGHIKAYLEESGCSVSLSGTGGPVTEQETFCRKVKLYFTAIAFAVEEEEICEFLNRKLE